MLDKFINKINNVIDELNGRRIEKIEGVLIPEYLYSFPNGIWMSFDLDKKDGYFEVKLGRLFIFKDVSTRAIVLENIDYYFIGLNKMKLAKIDYNFNHHMYALESMFDLLNSQLKTIIENYFQLIKNERVKALILKEEKRLSPYLLKNISNSTNLEKDFQEYSEVCKSVNKKFNASKVLKKENIRKNLIGDLLNGLGELLVMISILVVGMFIAWLCSLKKDISNIPLEVFMILGIILVIMPIAFIIAIIVFLIKNKRNK